MHGAKTHQAGVGIAVVVELLELIHPHFSGTDAVGQGLFAGVGSLLGENVAHVRARVCLQDPTALPDLHTERRRGHGSEQGVRCGSIVPAARRPSTDIMTNTATLSPSTGGRPLPQHPQNTERRQSTKAPSRQTSPGTRTPSPCTKSHALVWRDPSLTSLGTHSRRM